MNALLDTHAFLWWLDDNPTLSQEARAAIRDPENVIFVSAASIWEISIKKALGKLRASDNLEAEIEANHFVPLAVSVSHASAIASLPDLHRDPFDRMLAAQALAEDLTLITRDERLMRYDVPVLVA